MDIVQQLELGRLAEHVLAGVVGGHVVPLLALNAPDGAQRAFVAEEQVGPLEGQLELVVGELVSEGHVGVGHVDGIIVGHALIAGGAGQRQAHLPVLVDRAAHGLGHVQVAQVHRANQAGLGIDQRGEHGVGLGIGGGVYQALAVQAGHILEAFLEAFLIVHGLEHAIVKHQEVIALVMAEGVHEHIVREAVPGIGTGHGYLVGLAVAVGVAGLERAQHVGELIGGGGHLQAQGVQPGGVHVELAALLHAVEGALHTGHAVDVAIRHGQPGEYRRVALSNHRVVVAVAVDEVGYGAQYAFLNAIALDVGILHAGEQHLRVGAGVEHEHQLFGDHVAGQRGDVQGDAGLLLHPLCELVVHQVGDARGVLHYGGGEGHALGQRQGGRRFGRGERGAGQQHAERQQQRCQFPHFCFLLFYQATVPVVNPLWSLS